ncbi:MAG: D-aminoacyl-tRNA deacylase, partial [Deltaproteobacteria bacterium]|nr:D-aminoacyl-tRNA deacylase [Deltaproteobacteria bacterium]
MRVVIQRVSEASVHANGECTGRIGMGLVVLLGIAADDAQSDADYLSEKILGLRIVPDEAGKFAYSV